MIVNSMHKFWITVATMLVVFVAAGCGAAEPVTIVETVEVEKEVIKEVKVVETVEVVKEVEVVETVEVIKEVEKEVEVMVEPSTEAFTLRFLTNPGDFAKASREFMMASYSGRYPNGEIEVEFAAEPYADNVVTMAAAGNLPDILFSADIFTAPFVDAGVLLDMQPYAEADPDFDLDDVYESILGLGRVDGDPGLYMIPVSLDNVQMYYNKSLFESAGAPLPEADWTWDDMIASCKVLQATHEDVKCLGIGQDSTGPIRFNWWAYWVPWIRGYGGDVLSEDGTQSTLSSPEALAGLQAYADLWAKHDVAIPIGAEFGGNCFVNQRCAVWFHIPIFASVFREQVEEGAFEWDTQVIPSLPEGKFTGMGTFGYAVSSGTEHPQEAWDFVKAVASPTGQRIMGSKYEVMPLLKSLADDPLWDELEPPPANYKNTFVDGQAYGTLPSTYPTDCGSLYQGQVHDAITSALETVIRGRATAEEVFPDVDAQIQACLDRAN